MLRLVGGVALCGAWAFFWPEGVAWPHVQIASPHGLLTGLLTGLHLFSIVWLTASLVAPRRLRLVLLALPLPSGSARRQLALRAAHAGAAGALLGLIAWPLAHALAVSGGEDAPRWALLVLEWASVLFAVVMVGFVVGGRPRGWAWAMALALGWCCGAVAGRMWLVPLAMGAGAVILTLLARRVAPPFDRGGAPITACALVGLAILVGVPAHPLSALWSVEGYWSQHSESHEVMRLRAGRLEQFDVGTHVDANAILFARYERSVWGLRGTGASPRLRVWAELWPWPMGARAYLSGLPLVRRSRFDAERMIRVASRAARASLRQASATRVVVDARGLQVGGDTIRWDAVERVWVSYTASALDEGLPGEVSVWASMAGVVRWSTASPGHDDFVRGARDHLGIPSGRWAALAREQPSLATVWVAD